MSIKLVHSQEPTGKAGVRQRVRKMVRPDGGLKCPNCGCQTSLTTVNGAFVLKGRKQGGTVIHKDVCSECWRRGIIVSMLPELKPVE